MEDHIITILIRLGDAMDLFSFSGTFVFIDFSRVFFFVSLFLSRCSNPMLRAFEESKQRQNQGELLEPNTSLSVILHVQRFFFFFSVFFFLLVAFYLHKRRVFCTIGLSRSLLCACCISLFGYINISLCVCVSE